MKQSNTKKAKKPRSQQIKKKAKNIKKTNEAEKAKISKNKQRAQM